MITTIVDVFVKNEFIADFIKATEKNHLGSITEPENLRFDIIQNESDPTHFVLYEAYITEEGILSHKQTPHYNEWRQTVENMMQKPRKGTRFKIIFPKN